MSEVVEINQQHRAKMEALEDAMLRELEPAHMELEHLFAHGTYTRVLHIPAGTVLTGHIHRHSTINIIPSGKILIAMEDGDKVVEGPTWFVSGPGTKKAGYALEDTVWINVLPNENEDREIEVLENKSVYKEGYAQLEREQRLLLEEK